MAHKSHKTNEGLPGQLSSSDQVPELSSLILRILESNAARYDDLNLPIAIGKGVRDAPSILYLITCHVTLYCHHIRVPFLLYLL